MRAFKRVPAETPVHARSPITKVKSNAKNNEWQGVTQSSVHYEQSLLGPEAVRSSPEACVLSGTLGQRARSTFLSYRTQTCHGGRQERELILRAHFCNLGESCGLAYAWPPHHQDGWPNGQPAFN